MDVLVDSVSGESPLPGLEPLCAHMAFLLSTLAVRLGSASSFLQGHSFHRNFALVTITLGAGHLKGPKHPVHNKVNSTEL